MNSVTDEHRLIILGFRKYLKQFEGFRKYLKQFEGFEQNFDPDEFINAIIKTSSVINECSIQLEKLYLFLYVFYKKLYFLTISYFCSYYKN